MGIWMIPNDQFFIFGHKTDSTMVNRILSHDQIQHKVKRIAYQIYEANVNEKEIIVAGITGGGLNLATALILPVDLAVRGIKNI